MYLLVFLITRMSLKLKITFKTNLMITLGKVSERNLIRANLSHFEICFQTILELSEKNFESPSMKIALKSIRFILIQSE